MDYCFHKKAEKKAGVLQAKLGETCRFAAMALDGFKRFVEKYFCKNGFTMRNISVMMVAKSAASVSLSKFQSRRLAECAIHNQDLIKT